MLKRALALLLLIPLFDLLGLVVLAQLIGLAPTVLLVVLTALVGLLFVRAEGRHTVRRIGLKMERGEPPTDELLDAGLLVAAGAFLLTPGLVTDLVGALLVVPPTRYVIRAVLKKWVIVPVLDARTGGFVTGRVYTQGYPGWGPTGGPYEPGDDAYHVDVEWDDDTSNGKA